MSSFLRDVIPIMDLVAEIIAHDFQVICTAPHVFCKVFEDDAGALELARLPKLRGKIKIFPISTNDQIADLFTKAQNTFVKHGTHMCRQ